MPRITLTISTPLGNIPVHVNPDSVSYFKESLAKNRPGTWLYFSAPTGMDNPIFVEETFKEITEKENQNAPL